MCVDVKNSAADLEQSSNGMLRHTCPCEIASRVCAAPAFGRGRRLRYFVLRGFARAGLAAPALDCPALDSPALDCSGRAGNVHTKVTASPTQSLSAASPRPAGSTRT